MLVGLHEVLRAVKKRVALIRRTPYDQGMLKTIANEMVVHEKLDRPVTKIVIGPKEWNRLRTNPATRHAIKHNTVVSEMNLGIMGKLWGAKLFVRKNMGGKIAVFS